jgi:hypothetical protein
MVLEEKLAAEQWPRIDFTVPSSAAHSASDTDFTRAADRLKALFSAAQRQICLLTSTRGGNSGPQCQQLKANAQRSMNARLGMVMGRFRACQQAYVAQLQHSQALMAKRVSTKPALTLPETSPPPISLSDDPSQYQQLAIINDVDRQIRADREAAIHRIVESVLFLKGILEQMQTLALEQGSMLDRIDTHVQDAACFVAQARSHVERRETQQKDFFVRKCVLLGLITFIFLALLHLASR